MERGTLSRFLHASYMFFIASGQNSQTFEVDARTDFYMQARTPHAASTSAKEKCALSSSRNTPDSMTGSCHTRRQDTHRPFLATHARNHARGFDLVRARVCEDAGEGVPARQRLVARRAAALYCGQGTTTLISRP